MIRIYFRNILRFFTVLFLQVLLLDNIHLGGYLSPFFYLIFIILLPFETPNWLVLILAFLMGLSVDFFNGTPGMHASALVFMAFLRPFILKNFSPRDGYESGSYPRVFYYGIEWFTKYAILMILAHHFFYYFVESYRISELFYTLFRIILSTLLTTVIIVLSQFFIYRK
ncbi:MAG: rod shape-determining protein MreD [Bacteroidales bacterium]|nr:rod shape-determining protein MreD [Bacteroidales bacterium]